MKTRRFDTQKHAKKPPCRNEDESQTSVQRLRALFDTMDEGVVLVTPKGKVLQTNAVAQRIVGLSRREMERHNYFGPKWEVLGTDGAAMPKKDRPSVRAMREKRLIKDTVMGFKRKGGAICWVNVSAAPLLSTAKGIEGIVITFDDITKRKNTEEALHESEERFKAIFNNAVDGILIVDRDTRIIADANPAMCRMLGRNCRQIVGAGIQEIHPEAELPHILAQYEAKIDKPLEFLPEAPVKAKDGRVLYADINPFRLRLEGREYLAGIYRDATERRQARRRLLEQQKQLRALAADLMVAEETERRRIATGLHDDINQMLIGAKLKLAELSLPNDREKIEEIAAKVTAFLDRVLSTSQSLVFDLVSPVLQKLGLEAALEELCERMQRQHGIQFIFESKTNKKRLRNELEILLFHAVRELLRNVVKHAEAQNVKVTCRRKRRHVTISVKDDGNGFHRKPDAEGLTPEGGFGLFTIHERMSYLGGTVNFESVSPHGSRVTISVPLSAAEGVA
jgi:PAS domain S-box-containing protein